MGHGRGGGGGDVDVGGGCRWGWQRVAAARGPNDGDGGGGAFRPTATATTHDREGYGRPGRDIELVARGGRATSIDSSAPETKAWGSRRRCRPFAHLPPPRATSRYGGERTADGGGSVASGDDAVARDTARRCDTPVRAIAIGVVGLNRCFCCSTRGSEGVKGCSRASGSYASTLHELKFWFRINRATSETWQIDSNRTFPDTTSYRLLFCLDSKEKDLFQSYLIFNHLNDLTKHLFFLQRHALRFKSSGWTLFNHEEIVLLFFNIKLITRVLFPNYGPSIHARAP